LDYNVWIDVEDLFEYAKVNSRPSGIQRLAFEVYTALQNRYGSSGRIHFVRHHPVQNTFVVVSWEVVESLFRQLIAFDQTPQSTRMQTDFIPPHSRGRQAVRRLVYRIPSRARTPLIQFVVLQSQAAAAVVAFVRALWGYLPDIWRRFFSRRTEPAQDGAFMASGPISDGDTLTRAARPGDVLMVLGSPWFHPDYGSLVERLRAKQGIRLVLLVYDIIPLRRPEWCDRGLVRIFRAWFHGVLPLCDSILAISRASAADLEAYAKERGLALPGPVQPIPIGTGFAAGGSSQSQRSVSLDELGLTAGSYALLVSTVEARKNHVLVFRVWRRMLEEMPPEQVPSLVFAGRIGWLVADLMQQLENTNFLDGKIIVVRDPSDQVLEILYHGCLFTVFPSLYEGWGLPVTESLAFGKPCIISDRASLPEAGGCLARYFNPESVEDAYRVIRGTIVDRQGLAAWQERVEREFRPRPWDETAQAIIRYLDHPRQPRDGSAGTSKLHEIFG
jgi:glycosyltransferase involved in cell wall biosynthesis